MAGDVCKPIAQQLNILHSIMKRGEVARSKMRLLIIWERHPATQYVDILLTDLNGSFRGKRIPVSGLKNWKKAATSPRRCSPWTSLATWWRRPAFGQELGEPDRICLPVPGSLTPSAADPEHIGQVLLTMLDEDGTP